MSNVEQLQHAVKDQSQTAMASAQTFAASVQSIAAAHADYAKKAMQQGTEFIAQLATIKEPVKVIELHSEYLKSAYEMLAAESKRISELYADLLKQSYKPIEEMFTKTTSTK